MAVVNIPIEEGSRNALYVDRLESKKGLTFMYTCRSTDMWDEREYKIYFRQNDGVIIAVPQKPINV